MTMKESEFQKAVVDYAELNGWWVWHDNYSLRNRAGLLDLIMIREKVIWAELKVGKNKPTPAQEDVVNRLSDAGALVFVWKPENWDAIERTLQKDFNGTPRVQSP